MGIVGDHDVRIHRVLCAAESKSFELNSNNLAKREKERKKKSNHLDPCHSYAEKYFICMVYEELQVFKF